MAEPGAIVLSVSVYEQVRDKLALPFRDLGSRSVKNIDRPVRIYALDPAALAEGAPALPGSPRRRMDGGRSLDRCGGGTRGRGCLRLLLRPAPCAVEEAATAVTAPAETGLSVAVLVFANQSGDAGQDYFSDGLSEDITRALGRFKQLTVLSYGAVLPVQGQEHAAGRRSGAR